MFLFNRIISQNIALYQNALNRFVNQKQIKPPIT